ncbi:MAG: lysophospholipid acyltransferase family protein [Gammaproteobacteria bacterium]
MQYLLIRLRNSLFGACAGTIFAAVSLTTLIILGGVPRLSTRRRIARRAARILFSVPGITLSIRGLSHIPPEPCIIVANHASYLDGPILTAALPPRFGFVIKREMTTVPLAHYFLRRIGSEFVERNDAQRTASDARRILQRARAHESLAFFPEGTFRAEPGLRRFHNGAFAAARRGGLVIVPVVIRGSRHLLPASRWLPLPGRLEVIVKPPLLQTETESVASLLQQARHSILEDLGEPDLQT